MPASWNHTLKKIIKNRIVQVSALVIVLGLGVFGFFHYRDAVFSKEIVHLEISGPETAIMGEEVTYKLKYKNNSNFTLEQAKIIFELPQHSLTEDSKTRLTQDIQDISAGEERMITFTTRLLGKEEDLKVARASLTYIPHNLSARYESTATFTTKISMVPLMLVFDLPDKVEKNKQITYELDYFSGVDYPLENLSVKIEAVPGFNVVSSTPESLDNAEWKLDVMQKGQTGKISITGLAVADAGTRFNFSARLGMRINGTFVTLKEMKQETEVTPSQLVISQQINGSFGGALSAGELLNWQVVIKNTSETPTGATTATVRLSGSAFDFSTLQAPLGQIQAGPSISFPVPSLSPGQEVTGSFTIKLKDTITEADTVIRSTVTVDAITQTFERTVNVGSVVPPNPAP